MSIHNWVVVSDLHCGCRLGLCPPEGVALDDGGTYLPSRLQSKVWAFWREAWDDWVPHVTHGEPYALVVNGDAVDGVPHRATTPISANLEDQTRIARAVLAPLVERASAYYHVRGTEAHVGKAGVEEERLARDLGAIPNEDGMYARYELWARCGPGLIHFLHHIGVTGSSAYEATAVNKELNEEFAEAARWREEPPDIIVRSHRHRHIEVRVPTARGYGIAFTTAAWQLKTPFAWKVPGGRLAPPQLGVHLIRYGDEDLYTRHRVWHLSRARVEQEAGA